MKRILAGILLSVWGTWCAYAEIPWNELKESAYARKIQIQAAESRPKAVIPTLLPRILNGEPIKVNIENPYNAELSEQVCDRLTGMIQNSYNAWFQNAMTEIKTQERETEFADIKRTLENGVMIRALCVSKKTSSREKKGADLIVSFKEDLADVQKACKSNDCVGCKKLRRGKPMLIIISFNGGTDPLGHVYTPADIHRTLVHEVGHTLGLGDTYTHDNASDFGSANWETDNIMGATSNELTADDADGLINLMDSWNLKALKEKYASAWQEHVSKRVLEGWNGLDKDENGKPKDRYVMGNSVCKGAAPDPKCPAI